MTWEENVKVWQEFTDLEPALKEDLEAMDEKQLKDAFWAPLEFGTAGMRGIVGAGINRMNTYTVRQATEGLARFIEEAGAKAKERGVAISFDSRHYSPEFAMEAAQTLAKHGIKSFVFESLRPTPELSFAVRYLNAYAGIMVTASHNPPAYNGYKVYGEDGAQMPPHNADRVIKYVREVENPLDLTAFKEETDLITVIGEEVDRAYLDNLKTVLINPELLQNAGDMKIVYTPLHGTGKMLVERALDEAGFTGLEIVPEQAVPDANFTTVKSPNPEDPKAFEYSIRLGKEKEADLLLATDPDADRLGVAVRMPNGEYQVLSGNQTAALLLDYILQALKENNQLPADAATIKSIVSSELPTKIATSYGVLSRDVLTGFKFIAEQIHNFETTDKHTFVFGFEESIGFLIKPFVRDKDAIQAVLLLTEIAIATKKEGKTLFDRLQDLYEKHGYFAEKTNSIVFPGIEGAEKISNLMINLRENSPQSIGGLEVVKLFDFQKRIATSKSGETEDLVQTKSNVLKFILEDGSWVAARPSGTEPKIKFYMSAEDTTLEAAQAKLIALEADIMKFAE
ncbi:phosphoglucomutase [Granulicatella balaenopterae]|uniref:Phosphoglucomutase n=1 Tax=Granulicatella balaenopterae TaxID=137733 RepID=A0A1H9NKZ3_9LACT|nr:phospho-sugar mutase [Granulicatella balaenopterae]SER36620.1 phosphoglucomutase [Granulicatella balaenopterae]